MQTITCADLRGWLVHHSAQPTVASPAESRLDPYVLDHHVLDCARCRGALMMLLVALDQVPLPLEAITHAECQAQLAAYIDEEQHAGTPAARASYPQVWWHLWICASCAETYALTLALLDAEQHGLLPAMPIVPPVPRRRYEEIARQQLPRALITRTLGVQGGLGISRGDDTGEIVLVDGDWPGFQLTLSVQQQPDGAWTIRVLTDPPIRGRILLTLGTTLFTATFDPSGTALVASVPNELLTAIDGPDLLLSIEIEDPDAS